MPVDLVWGAEGGLDGYLTSKSALGGGEPSQLSVPRQAFLALHGRLCSDPSDEAANTSVLVDIEGICSL